MKCIIVDRNKKTRSALEEFISQTTALYLISTCTTMKEALDVIKKDRIEIIFLNVENDFSEEMNVLRKGNHTNLQTIVITGTSKFASEAFDLDITDYIVRPLTWERFLQAISKAQKLHGTTQVKTDRNDLLFIKESSRLVKLNLSDIHYVQAFGDYVALQTKEKKHIVHQTMKGLLSKLPDDMFIRVHQSYIINLDKISFVEERSVTIDHKLIRVGRTYKKELTRRLKLL